MTFILRALSYSDTNGDFNWQDSVNYSVKAGVLTVTEKAKLESGVFYRDQVVFTSIKALMSKVKGSELTLAQKLISENVFTEDAYKAAVAQSAVK